ncbi:MAG TPA: hypothetical protein VH951_08405, partial [Dehalococcoidia bacterium]
MATSRPRFLAALAVLAVCSSLAAIATVEAGRAVGKPFPGFVWQRHGSLVAVSAMTSSSWPAFETLNWGEIVTSVNGRPGREAGAVASS